MLLRKSGAVTVPHNGRCHVQIEAFCLCPYQLYAPLSPLGKWVEKGARFDLALNEKCSCIVGRSILTLLPPTYKR